LRRVLEKLRDEDVSKGRKSSDQRKFIVVEGLYRNHGHICPLKELVALKNEFFFRLIVDDSLSFGTIGATGRGIIEHAGVDIEEVEIMTISMEHAMGSVGGLTIGNLEVVDHQRLSGAGYCYSASAPPFVASAACAALAILKENPAIVSNLHRNVAAMYKGLKAIKELEIYSDEMSPIIFVGLKNYPEDMDRLVAIGEEMIDGGATLFVQGQIHSATKNLCQGGKKSLRITVSSEFTPHDTKLALDLLKKAIATTGKAGFSYYS
jgi:serine palmitoyltransferase